MSNGFGDNRIRIVAWLIFILLLLVGGLYLGEWRAKQIVPAKAEPNEPSEIEKIMAGRDLRLTKSVLPAKLEAGWMPSDGNALTRQIEGFLNKADVGEGKDVIAIINPHAGYAYSGQTAAFGVKAAKSKYASVVVIGPSHRVYMSETLSVPRMTHYQTPLGEIPLDVKFIDKLLKDPIFKDVSEAYKAEHSVFIQLPMLQYGLGKFKLVPIVAGQCSPETIQKAAAILKGMVDSETLVVASSDFTHYGPNYGYVPFTQNIPDELKKLDMGAYDYIAKLDSSGFQQYCNRTGATICGRVPIAILLSILPATAKAELLKYTTSGELTGDFTNSVSYFSIAFHGQWPAPVSPDASRGSGQKQEVAEPATTDSALTPEDHNNLLLLARRTIDFYLRYGLMPTYEKLGVKITEPMKVQRAAFVTLKKNSELRGCIGEILPSQSLYKSVIVNAINAAVNDHRFVPVMRDELAGLKIEISALTVPQKISSYNQIHLGTDGIILRKEGHTALFLPQVAPEQKWTLEETLTHLSFKAGLPPDAWKQGAAFEVFQAEVFGEE